jgi:hypothetical protein
LVGNRRKIRGLRMIAPAFDEELPIGSGRETANARMYVVEAEWPGGGRRLGIGVGGREMQRINVNVHAALEGNKDLSTVNDQDFLVMNAKIRDAGLEEMRKKATLHDSVIVNGLSRRKLGNEVDGVGVVFAA